MEAANAVDHHSWPDPWQRAAIDLPSSLAHWTILLVITDHGFPEPSSRLGLSSSVSPRCGQGRGPLPTFSRQCDRRGACRKVCEVPGRLRSRRQGDRGLGSGIPGPFTAGRDTVDGNNISGIANRSDMAPEKRRQHIWQSSWCGDKSQRHRDATCI